MKPFDPAKVRTPLNRFPGCLPFRLVGPRSGRAVKEEIDTSSGLLAWKGHLTVAWVKLFSAGAAPRLGSEVTLCHYQEPGWLRMSKQEYDDGDSRLALAIASARRLVGFNGERIPMPSGFLVKQGILWDLASGEGTCIIDRRFRLHVGQPDAQDIVNVDGFEPIDDTPLALCRIHDNVAREAALSAFEASR